MYKLLPSTPMGAAQCIKRIADNAFIPFEPANTDYANFKTQVLDGAELQDADGKPMQDAVQFVKELP